MDFGIIEVLGGARHRDQFNVLGYLSSGVCRST